MGISPTRPALARNRTPYDIDSSRVDGTMEVDRRPVEQVPVCRPTRRGLAPAVQQPSVKELSAQPCPTADRTRLVRVRDARHTWAVRSTPALLSDRCTSARGTPQAFCRENRLWCCDDATPQGLDDGPLTSRNPPSAPAPLPASAARSTRAVPCRAPWPSTPAGSAGCRRCSGSPPRCNPDAPPRCGSP